MAERRGMLDDMADMFVPIHRDGHKFVAIGAVLTLLLFLVLPALGWVAALLTGFVAYFFRDPDRVTPLREGLIISPSDGKVLKIETVVPPSDAPLGTDPRTRISIALSPLDVHIIRTPLSGLISHAVYIPGSFVNASLDKASTDNERQIFTVKPHSGEEVGVVLIAGLITRRIVALANEGQRIGVGERIGLIRFGSRVDVYLPPDRAAHVAVGQRVIAGETVLTDLKSDEKEREARTN